MEKAEINLSELSSNGFGYSVLVNTPYEREVYKFYVSQDSSNNFLIRGDGFGLEGYIIENSHEIKNIDQAKLLAYQNARAFSEKRIQIYHKRGYEVSFSDFKGIGIQLELDLKFDKN